ncbi:hypothetical protein ACOME3_009897 [Neoechinorhynchus agilis]
MIPRTKFDDRVSEVVLVSDNEKTALIEHPDGRRDLVSTQRPAPPGEDLTTIKSSEDDLPSAVNSGDVPVKENINAQHLEMGSKYVTEHGLEVRRSCRIPSKLRAKGEDCDID